MVSAALAVLAGCGPSSATLSLNLMDAARCSEFCIERFDVFVAGVPTTVACGSAAKVTVVDTGQALDLLVVGKGSGSELTAHTTITAIEGQEVAVDLALAPASRPHITAIEAEEKVLFGPTRVTITGEGFGAAGDLTIGGMPAMIESWSDTAIFAVTAVSGDTVVSHCGVRSFAVPAPLEPLDIDVLTPLPASCATGRLIDGGAIFTGADAPLGLFECGAGCGSGLLATMTGDTFTAFDEFTGCPTAMSIVDADAPFLVVDGALNACTFAASQLACTQRATPPGPITRISALGAPVAFTRTSTAPGMPDELWVSNEMRSARIGEGFILDAFAIERRSVLARTARGIRALTWRASMLHEIDVDTAVMPCPVPRLMIATGPVPGQPNRLSITVCERAGGAEVRVFDLSTPPAGPKVSAFVRDFLPDAAAASRDGSLLVLWHLSGGALAFVDATSGEVLGKQQIPPTYAGAALVRSPLSDRFYLGGPEPGQVTRIVIPAR